MNLETARQRDSQVSPVLATWRGLGDGQTERKGDRDRRETETERREGEETCPNKHKTISKHCEHENQRVNIILLKCCFKLHP